MTWHDLEGLPVHVDEGHHESAVMVTSSDDGLALDDVVARILEGDRLPAGTGAVIFRGFSMTLSRFSDIANRSGGALDYVYGSTPRRTLGRGVYTASEYPPSERIVLHNEMSYTSPWPRYLWFWCVEPAIEGGCTPLASSHEVLRRLPEPIVDEFCRRGVAYVRTFAPGIDVSWQDAFGTRDRRAVEDWCEAVGIAYEWVTADILRTTQVGRSTVRHLHTGEECWFNQAHLFHRSRLDGSILAEHLDPDLRPRDATYGDGAAIPADIVRTIEETYDACAWRTDWHAGDVLLLDNVLVAHGRDPFVGSRQVLVAMEGALDHEGSATAATRPR